MDSLAVAEKLSLEEIEPRKLGFAVPARRGANESRVPCSLRGRHVRLRGAEHAAHATALSGDERAQAFLSLQGREQGNAGKQLVRPLRLGTR
jgi:hypothetical protein